MTPHALFVCRSSPYWELLGADRCWDIKRDATGYDGEAPVIAHPPCRGWGRYRHLAKTRPGETDLAWFSLELVRRVGGVLEHPRSSSFWRRSGITLNGQLDIWGGFGMVVRQCDFGHRAEKTTGLYFVRPVRIPPLPPARPWSVPVEKMGRQERERTPVELASWLVAAFTVCSAPLPPS